MMTSYIGNRIHVKVGEAYYTGSLVAIGYDSKDGFRLLIQRADQRTMLAVDPVGDTTTECHIEGTINNL